MILFTKTTLTHHCFQGAMILGFQCAIRRFSYIATYNQNQIK